MKIFDAQKVYPTLYVQFQSFLDDKSEFVVCKIFENINEYISGFTFPSNEQERQKFLLNVLQRLFNAESLLAKNWKSHKLFFESLEKSFQFFNSDQIWKFIFPLCKKAVKSASIPTKVVLARLLCLILCQIVDKGSRIEFHEYIKSLVIFGTSIERIFFFDFVGGIYKKISKHYFRENFLDFIYSLAESEKVPSVLIKLCNSAELIRRFILLDDEINGTKVLKMYELIFKKNNILSIKEKANDALQLLKSENFIDSLNDLDEGKLTLQEKEIYLKEKKANEEQKKKEIEALINHAKQEYQPANKVAKVIYQ